MELMTSDLLIAIMCGIAWMGGYFAGALNVWLMMRDKHGKKQVE